MQAAYQDLSAPAPDLTTSDPDPFFDANSHAALPPPPRPFAAPTSTTTNNTTIDTTDAFMSSFAPVPTSDLSAAPTKVASPNHVMPQNFFNAVNAQLLSAYVPGASLVPSAMPIDGDGFPVVDPLPADAGLMQKVGYYYACAKNFKDRKVAHMRPWRDFFSKDDFSIPGKLEALSRVSDNLSYFNSNYVALVSVMSLYILITNLSFMVGMLVCAGLYYFIRMKQAANQNIYIHTYEFTPTQSFVGLGIGGLITFYMTGGSSTVFWLVTCAAVAVLGHAVTRRPMQRLAEPANTQISFA